MYWLVFTYERVTVIFSVMIVKKQGLIQVKIIRNQEKNVDSARIHEIYKIDEFKTPSPMIR